MTAWEPLCMTPAEFASWREMNGRVAGNNQAKRPCEDCPLGYAAEMRGYGMCNGSPGGVEEEDEVEIQQLKAKAAVVAVNVVIPCERCVHREVCAIRQQVKDLDQVETELPALNAALKPTLTMSIECGFFQAERGAKRQASEAALASQRANAEKARAAMAAKRAAAATDA